MPDDIEIRTEVVGADVVDDIGDAIIDGIRESSRASRRRSIGQRMRREAQQKIVDEGRVWSGELLESFEVQSRQVGPVGAVIRLINDASHAAAVDEGAEYGDEGPPLHELIPWVATNMKHLEIDDNGALKTKDG